MTQKEQIEDLEGTIEEATDILEEAYTPESTREELAEACGNALDTLSGEEVEEGDEGE